MRNTLYIYLRLLKEHTNVKLFTSPNSFWWHKHFELQLFVYLFSCLYNFVTLYLIAFKRFFCKITIATRERLKRKDDARTSARFHVSFFPRLGATCSPGTSLARLARGSVNVLSLLHTPRKRLVTILIVELCRGSGFQIAFFIRPVHELCRPWITQIVSTYV